MSVLLLLLLLWLLRGFFYSRPSAKPSEAMLEGTTNCVCVSINFILNGISLKNNICGAQLHLLLHNRPPTCCASWACHQTVNICDTGFKCWQPTPTSGFTQSPPPPPPSALLLQPNICCPFAVSPSAACKLVRYYNIQQHCNLATLIYAVALLTSERNRYREREQEKERESKS